ncbi:MAG: AMP phosphorylase [archaeon]
MRLKTKILNMESGGTMIVALHPDVVKEMDLGPSDRVRVMAERHYAVVIADVSSTIKPTEIGVFEEVRALLDLHPGEPVTIIPEEKPLAILSIKKKMAGGILTKDEIFEIVTDIVDNRLTQPEIAMFVAAAYMKDFTLMETENLTKAMAETGQMLKLGFKPVLDVHSIGGVPGNRTTMIIVPIIAAAGYYIPKTASRAITDPAGTADVMEVAAPVTLELDKIKEIVTKHHGCIVWGGGIDVAPADDIIIKVESPMQLDPTAMMLSSILAKKYAIGATDVLMEIPYGTGTKCMKPRADSLEKKFKAIGKTLGMNIVVEKITGSEPIGNGIGPSLELRDCLLVLEGNSMGPQDLKKKSLRLAGKLLEMAGAAKSGAGLKIATHILESGKAHRKFLEMVKAQGGNPAVKASSIKIGKYDDSVFAESSGKVRFINNEFIKRLGRHLGAPYDKCAGIYLYKHVGDKVKEGEKLFSVYAESGRKLADGLEFAEANNPYTIK